MKALIKYTAQTFLYVQFVCDNLVQVPLSLSSFLTWFRNYPLVCMKLYSRCHVWMIYAIIQTIWCVFNSLHCWQSLILPATKLIGEDWRVNTYFHDSKSDPNMRNDVGMKLCMVSKRLYITNIMICFELTTLPAALDLRATELKGEEWRVDIYFKSNPKMRKDVWLKLCMMSKRHPTMKWMAFLEVHRISYPQNLQIALYLDKLKD